MTEYAYEDYNVNPDPPHQPLYLNPVLRFLRTDSSIRTVLDVGCGDGNFTASIAEANYRVYGIDMSPTGIDIAVQRKVGDFAKASAYDDLKMVFPDAETFDAIVSVEVIEHLYNPRIFVRRAFEALRPGGLLVLTTPYWGYLKNIVLAVTGRLDGALTSLWDGGHIKHWSRRTLTTLLSEQPFDVFGFQGAGRPIPYLWSGMVVAARRRS